MKMTISKQSRLFEVMEEISVVSVWRRESSGSIDCQGKEKGKQYYEKGPKCSYGPG